MLILTRRPGERVVIGEDILVTVMGVSGHTVRLGIAAPSGVPIYREEIWLAVKEENRAAAAAGADALPPALPASGGQPPRAEGGEPPAERGGRPTEGREAPAERRERPAAAPPEREEQTGGG